MELLDITENDDEVLEPLADGVFIVPGIIEETDTDELGLREQITLEGDESLPPVKEKDTPILKEKSERKVRAKSKSKVSRKSARNAAKKKKKVKKKSKKGNEKKPYKFPKI